MKPTMLLQLVFAVFLFAVQHVCAKTAIVGDSFTFTANDKICAGGTECILSKSSSKTGPVASRVNGEWKGETGYEKRIEHVSPTEFKLKDFKMTDGGTYELSGHIIQLTGLAPVNLPVMEGEAATLQSHFDTNDKDLRLTGWDRDGQPVCEAHTGAGTTATGTPCAPQDWNESGNLSLFLPRVRKDQQGLYLSYVRDGHGRTDVTAVRLTVLKRKPDPVLPEPTLPPEENTHITWIAVIVVLSVLAAAGWGWALCLKFRRSSPGPGAAGEQPNGYMNVQASNGHPALPLGQHEQTV